MNELTHTRQDRIRNEYIREKIRIASIMEKMVESYLRWFRHIWRRPIETLVRRVDHMESSIIAGDRGIPRKIMDKTIKRDVDF